MSYKIIIKKSFLIILVLCTVFISSCGINGKQTESEYMTPTEKAESDLMMIVKSINDRDTAAIKALLSRSVCNSVDADSKINEMFEFIDGEIVSYDDPFGSAAGSMEKRMPELELKASEQIKIPITILGSRNGTVMTNSPIRWGYIT